MSAKTGDLEEVELVAFEFANAMILPLMGEDPYTNNIARLVAEVRRRRGVEALASVYAAQAATHCHGEFCGCTCRCEGCSKERG